eukprot:6210667-Pleurochrysis_carterae.AAC.1
MSMACVVLEPGAAHMSSRRQPPLCPSSATGSIDASSCAHGEALATTRLSLAVQSSSSIPKYETT